MVNVTTEFTYIYIAKRHLLGSEQMIVHCLFKLQGSVDLADLLKGRTLHCRSHCWARSMEKNFKVFLSNNVIFNILQKICGNSYNKKLLK